MAKKTANNAIDFARLFAVKEQMARDAEIENESRATVASSIVLETERVGAANNELDVEEPTAVLIPEAVEATILPFPSEPAPVLESAPQGTPAAAESATTAPAKAPRRKASQRVAEQERDVLLRVGMTRELHDRVRAYAALLGKSPTFFASEVLEESTPEFDATAPLAKLAKVAKDAAPAKSVGPRSVEVRMQVPTTDAVHRRLVQLAALRAQTLAAALLDLFEANVPAM